MPTLTAQTIADLPAPPTGNKLYWFKGAIVQGRQIPRGLGIRVTANGSRAFILSYSIDGKERRITIGDTANWTIPEAVKRARELRKLIDRGTDPMAERHPAPVAEIVTVNAVIDRFLERTKIRRPEQYQSTFDRLVRPTLGAMPITELKRRHVIDLLDAIEDGHGPVAATRALAYLRSALNKWAERDEDFQVPIVRGMARSSTAARARSRILSDTELRTLWPALDASGNFGRCCKFSLLTAARRSEAAGMTWDELADGVWVIPPDRYKTAREHVLPLSQAALAIVEAQPRTAKLVFPGEGGRHLSRGSSNMQTLAKRTPEITENWSLHDLRRTARSLLSRAGVNSDVAERVLGHVIAGVRATYDRHTFLEEKRDALQRLAALVERILSPADNVIPLRAG
jgi:integrase